MSKAITLYLIGFAGVGKYTIAKSLASYGYKIVDNHLINNPILSLLDLDGITPISKNIWDIIKEIRISVLKFVAQDLTSNYVFTNELLEEARDHDVYNQVKNAAEERGSIFIPVILKISSDEHKLRIETEERKSKFKETKFPKDRFQKGLIHIHHPNLQELDISDLRATDAAEKILNLVQKIESKNFFKD